MPAAGRAVAPRLGAGHLERLTKPLKHKDHKENFAPRGSRSVKGEVAHQVARSAGVKNSLFFVVFVSFVLR
jgi:hypothetical protein